MSGKAYPCPVCQAELFNRKLECCPHCGCYHPGSAFAQALGPHAPCLDYRRQENNSAALPSRYGKFGAAFLTLCFWLGPLLALAVTLFLPEPHLSHAWGQVFDHPIWLKATVHDRETEWDFFCARWDLLLSPPSCTAWLQLGMSIVGKIVPLALGLAWLLAFGERCYPTREARTGFLWPTDAFKSNAALMAGMVSSGVTLPLLIFAICTSNASVLVLGLLTAPLLPLYFLVLMLIDNYAPSVGRAAFSVYGAGWENCIRTTLRICRWFTLRNLRLQCARAIAVWLGLYLSPLVDYLAQNPSNHLKSMGECYTENMAWLTERLKQENQEALLDDFAPSLPSDEKWSLVIAIPLGLLFSLWLPFGVMIRIIKQAVEKRQYTPSV